MLELFCFFFKQKTAYEMRISDWSSDVCSSDLLDTPLKKRFREVLLEQAREEELPCLLVTHDQEDPAAAGGPVLFLAAAAPSKKPDRLAKHPAFATDLPAPRQRSEEHTSELQSLMRISYAVFCLKKTNHN